MVGIASGLAQRGHSVTVVTSDAVGQSSYYPLDPLVNQINLNIGSVSRKTKVFEACKRILEMRRVISNLKPDVVIGFMNSTYMLLFFALKGLGIPLVASEHVGPEYYESRPFQRFLYHFMPFVATKIVVVSERVKLKFSRRICKSVFVIPNPVSFELEKQANVRGDSDEPKILLAVGRLDSGKNHKDLISAFGAVSGAVPDWNLHIVGDGELREELANQIHKLHLEDRIKLQGTVKDIRSEYLSAQLFVLPSLYESFGMVVAEALVHGLPVVGFADCSGINQLIRHNENGLLVAGEDRVESLANALKSLMLNDGERCRLGAASVNWLVEKYDINTILDMWERLLSK